MDVSPNIFLKRLMTAPEDAARQEEGKWAMLLSPPVSPPYTSIDNVKARVNLKDCD
jgi:nitric oxide synthase oxygenase domain/subunit